MCSGNDCIVCFHRIPKVRVLEDEEGTKEIELSDDPYDCIRLNVDEVPCIVTLSKVSLTNFCLPAWRLQFLLISPAIYFFSRDKIGITAVVSVHYVCICLSFAS